MDFPIFNERFRYYVESNNRLNDELKGINQHLFRTALGYRIRPNIEFYQGYLLGQNFTPAYLKENRIYQQLGIGHVLRKKLQVFHRFRSEQRFIQFRNGTANRLRYFLRLAYPIKNTFWYLVAYDEIFVNVNSLKGGPVAGVDQNRLYAGVGRQVNKHVRAEIAYQWQYINRRDPFADKAAHQLMTQFFINF